MKKAQKLIKNKDLINIFKKSKIKNYLNKKYLSNFFYLLIKFKKIFKQPGSKIFFFKNIFFQKYFFSKISKQKKISNFIKLSIYFL
jgi:hypothetical protein